MKDVKSFADRGVDHGGGHVEEGAFVEAGHEFFAETGETFGEFLGGVSFLESCGEPGEDAVEAEPDGAAEEDEEEREREEEDLAGPFHDDFSVFHFTNHDKRQALMAHDIDESRICGIVDAEGNPVEKGGACVNCDNCRATLMDLRRQKHIWEAA